MKSIIRINLDGAIKHYNRVVKTKKQESMTMERLSQIVFENDRKLSDKSKYNYVRHWNTGSELSKCSPDKLFKIHTVTGYSLDKLVVEI